MVLFGTKLRISLCSPPNFFVFFPLLLVLQASSSSPVVCRESLHVVDIRRYSRDPASAIYFPQAVLSGEMDRNKADTVSSILCDLHLPSVSR